MVSKVAWWKNNHLALAIYMLCSRSSKDGDQLEVTIEGQSDRVYASLFGVNFSSVFGKENSKIWQCRQVWLETPFGNVSRCVIIGICSFFCSMKVRGGDWRVQLCVIVFPSNTWNAFSAFNKNLCSGVQDLEVL